MPPGDERRVRILARLNAAPAAGGKTQQLCALAAEVTDVSGAGIMLMSDDLPAGAACTTDTISALLEDLQFELGEGPCVDAYHHQEPVLEPNLAAPLTPRWPGFAAPAVAAGVRAVFGFPLQLGFVRLGSVNLYRTEPGPLSGDQHADALVVADIATRSLLMLQGDAPDGQLAGSLDAASDFHYVVHQAAGMVSVQLDVSVGQALIRLRAHAFGNGRPLVEVAQDVVARRLRFDAERGEMDGHS